MGDDPDLGHLQKEKDSRGYTSAIHVNCDYTEPLITDYDAKRRAAVIDRWVALEKQVQPQVPQSSTEALGMEVDRQEKLEQEQKLIADVV